MLRRRMRCASAQRMSTIGRSTAWRSVEPTERYRRSRPISLRELRLRQGSGGSPHRVWQQCYGMACTACAALVCSVGISVVQPVVRVRAVFMRRRSGCPVRVMLSGVDFGPARVSLSLPDACLLRGAKHHRRGCITLEGHRQHDEPEQKCTRSQHVNRF